VAQPVTRKSATQPASEKILLSFMRPFFPAFSKGPGSSSAA
jgi:hypothetical protein